MTRPQDVLYAFVGASDLALERVGDLRKAADRDSRHELYAGFVTRGKKLSTRIKASAPSRQATRQTQVARSQVKAAATSLTKAVRANAKATRSAVTKAARAS